MQLVEGGGVSFKIEAEVTSLGHHTVYLYRCSLELSTFEYGCNGGAAFQGGKEKRQRGGTYEQPLSDKPPLIKSGETSSI